MAFFQLSTCAVDQSTRASVPSRATSTTTRKPTMKDYEDEAFDELDKAQQRLVATGVTNGELSGNVPVTHYKLVEPPKPVGAWVLYPKAPWKNKFMMYAKPTDEQIKNTEELLGWKWEDV